MWGGRFDTKPDALFCAINDSLPIDWRLVQQDVRGSIAWARALGRAGVLTDDEAGLLTDELEKIGREADAMAHPPIDSGAEDVHSWVEMKLVVALGSLGKKLHTGRSRNDQVATDLRLWTIEALDDLIGQIRSVQGALIDLGHATVEVVLPGYTHLQRAQPVSFAHWCLAYVEMFERDVRRAEAARKSAGTCPLGCAALAGTTYPIDRARIATELGFDEICQNSLDAVSDRDFVVDALACASVCSVHLSRMAEDLIVYASQEFGFVEPDDGMASGSSLMPQKKNPDALELLRGKCGRIMSAHAAMLTTIKGLPLAYNKDLQEDKAILFGAIDELMLCLQIARRVIAGLKVNARSCLEAARRGGTLATELADYLVSRGVPFRDAHDQVGRIVRASLERNVELDEMPIEAMREHAPAIGADVADWLSIAGALARRNVTGGTSPEQVRKALARARTLVATNTIDSPSASGESA
ncbi:MAG: argininosuccinate lyase [Planctomycetota bacterium]|nr:MAG: argininosuccinate lyase [Planctomycetota bacterium]